MKPVAIILARGGSKGIPRKNLRQIGGRTLLRWAIEAAQEAGLPHVWVSTDDGDIAAEARACGAGVIDRPEYLAVDEAESNDGLYHAIKTLKAADAVFDAIVDTIVYIEATHFPPRAENIRRVMAAFNKQTCETALSVRRACVPLWRRGVDGYGMPLNQFDRKRRQDADEEYAHTGECIVVDREEFLRMGQAITGRVALVEMEGEHVDIDTHFDLRVAQLIAAEMEAMA